MHVSLIWLQNEDWEIIEPVAYTKKKEFLPPAFQGSAKKVM